MFSLFASQGCPQPVLGARGGNGDYLVFGHNQAENAKTQNGLPSGGDWTADAFRWARHWYIDVTGDTTGDTVDLIFDYSEGSMDGDASQLPSGDAGNYRLLKSDDNGATFSDITATCVLGSTTYAGNRVSFTDVDVTCLGSTFTLGSVDDHASPTALKIVEFKSTTGDGSQRIRIFGSLLVMAFVAVGLTLKMQKCKSNKES